MVTDTSAILLEVLQGSTCFGIAHDASVPECKQCDVASQCKRKSEGAELPTPNKKVAKPDLPKEDKPVEVKKATKPASKSATTPAKKPSVAPKKTSTPSGNLPDFKQMSLEELKDLAKERSVEWKEYGNDNITRMRLIMALKPTYQ